LTDAARIQGRCAQYAMRQSLAMERTCSVGSSSTPASAVSAESLFSEALALLEGVMACSSPRATASRLDLPLPTGPTTISSSPALTEKDTSFSTGMSAALP